MPHDEFIKRIQKTLYSSSMSKCQISRPLSIYASDVFNNEHRGYSLNRLSYVTVGNLPYATPCSLLLSMIYLDRLRETDPMYSKRITPTELFLVSMVRLKFYYLVIQSVFIYVINLVKTSDILLSLNAFSKSSLYFIDHKYLSA